MVITSLSPTQASAERLLQLRRGHWTIEEPIASHARYDLWRGRLTGPLWQHTASHGGVVQCCANVRTRLWIY